MELPVCLGTDHGEGLKACLKRHIPQLLGEISNCSMSECTELMI